MVRCTTSTPNAKQEGQRLLLKGPAMVQPKTSGIKRVLDNTGGVKPEENQPDRDGATDAQAQVSTGRVREIGGPPGPEPTRYGDWERKGRCIDF